MSEQLGKTIVNYLVRRGISKDRIKAIGLGETQILNIFVNGAKCSEEEHMVNRRVEFKLKQQ